VGKTVRNLITMSTLSYFKTDNLKKLGVFIAKINLRHAQNLLSFFETFCMARTTLLRPKQYGYDKAELYTVYMQSNLQKM
jgi:hypothetical protein